MDFDTAFEGMHKKPFSGEDPNASIYETGQNIGPSEWYAAHEYSSSIGARNLISDPLFYSWPSVFTPTTTPTQVDTPINISPWTAYYTVASGATPTVSITPEGINKVTTMHSAVLVTSDVASASDHEVFVEGMIQSANWETDIPPFAAILVRVQRQIAGIDGGTTPWEVYFEFRSYNLLTSADTLIATSNVISNTDLGDGGMGILHLEGQYTLPNSVGIGNLVDYVRVISHMSNPSGTGSMQVFIGEPMVSLSYGTEPVPFAPAVGGQVVVPYSGVSNLVLTSDTTYPYGVKWATVSATATQVSRDATAAAADYVARIRITTDTQYRLTAGLNGSDQPQLLFGPGGTTAPDTRFYRSAAGTVTLDSNGASNLAELKILGAAAQRAVLTERLSGDTNERAGLWGDGTLTGLTLGPGSASPDLKFMRSGSGLLELTDNNQIAASFGIQFTIKKESATSGYFDVYVADSGAGASADLAGDSGAGGGASFTVRMDAAKSAAISLGTIGSGGEIYLGSGAAASAADTRFRRTGTKTVTFSDNAGGNATLNVTGTLQQGGVGVFPLTTKGDVYVYSTGPTRLGVGTDGWVLTADSTQATGLKWAASGGASGGTPALTLGTTNTAGVATTFIRTDDTILVFDATSPSTQDFGDAAAVGAATTAARRDHKHAMMANPVSYAAPNFTLGTANAAGAASTLVRSDATIALFDVTVPSTQAFGDAAATGSAGVAARRDHKHAMMADPTKVTTKGDLFTYSTVPTRLGVGTNGFALFADSTQTTGLIWRAIAESDVTNLTTDLAAKVANSDYSAKGAILVGTGVGTKSALALGTDTYVLTADSTTATGTKWAAAPGGTATQVDRASGAAGDYVARIKLTADTQYRLVAELRATTSEPQLLFGTGGVTAPDVRVSRYGASILQFDPTNTTTGFFRINAGTPGLHFGYNSTTDVYFYRSTTSTMILDANGLGSSPATLQMGSTGTINWGGNGLLDVNNAKLRLPVGTGALTATEGYATWQSATDDFRIYDGQRERTMNDVGWAPYAYAMGMVPSATYTTSLALAANGGSVAVAVFVPTHMLIQAIRYYNGTGTGTVECKVYRQYLNNGNAAENTLTEVTGAGFASRSNTASALQNVTVSTPGTYLAPGLYWVVLRNTHASTVFAMGGLAAGTFAAPHAQTKTLGSALGSTLDFVAATWTKINTIPGVRLDGRVFGGTGAF